MASEYKHQGPHNICWPSSSLGRLGGAVGWGQGHKTGQLLHFGAKLDKLTVTSCWGDSGFVLPGDLGHRLQKLFSQQLGHFPGRLSKCSALQGS